MNDERRISSSTPTVQLPDGDDAEELPSSLPSSRPPSAKPSRPSALLAELLPVIGSSKSINSPRSSITADSSAFDDHWPASLDTRRPSANTITLPKLSESQEVVEETNENQKAPVAPSAIDKLIEPLTASKQQKLQQKQAADDSQTRPGTKAKDLKEIFYEEEEKKLTLSDKPDEARTDNSTDGGKKSQPGSGEEKVGAEKEAASRAKGMIMNTNTASNGKLLSTAENVADTSPIMGGTGVNQSLPNLQSTIVNHPKVASLPTTNHIAGATHSKAGYSSAASIPGSISPSIARGLGGIPAQRAPNDSATASRVLISTPATPHSVSKSRSQQKSAIPEESVPTQSPMASSTPVKSAPDSGKSAPRAGHTMREFFNECGPDDLANEVKTAIQTLETVSAKVSTTNPGGGAVSQPSQSNDMVLGYIDWLLDKAKVYHEQATGKTYPNDQCEVSKLGNGWKREDLPPEKVGNYIQDMVKDAVSFSSGCSNQQHTGSHHSSPHDKSMRLRYTLRRPCCNRGGDPCSEAMTSSISAGLSSAEQSELSDLAFMHPGCQYQVPAAVARGCENVSASAGISKTQEIKSFYETCSSASSITECTSRAFETCSTKSTFADCPQISLQENMSFDDFANTFSENCSSMSCAASENFKCDAQENFSASQSRPTHGYPCHFPKLAQRPLVNICECKPACSNTGSGQQTNVSALKVNSPPSMGIDFYKSGNDFSCSTLTSECSSDGNSFARTAEEKNMGIIQQTVPNHSVNEPICEKHSKEQQQPHDYWYEPAPSSTLPTRNNQAAPLTGSTTKEPVIQTRSSSTCVPVSSDECLSSKAFEDLNVDLVQPTTNLSKECNPDPIKFGTNYNSGGFGATRKPTSGSSPFTQQPPNNQMFQMEKGNKSDIHVISGTSSSSTSSTSTPLSSDNCLTSTANQPAFGDSQPNQQTVEPYISGATNQQKDSSALVPCEMNVQPISPEKGNNIPSTSSTSGNSSRSTCSLESPARYDGCMSSDESNVDCPPATIENDVAKSTPEQRELGTPIAEAKFSAANTSMPCSSSHQPVNHPTFQTQGLSEHKDQTSRPEIDYSRTCSTCTPVSSDGCLSSNTFAEAGMPSIEKRATKSAPEQRERSVGGFGTTSMLVSMDTQPNQLQRGSNNDKSACNTQTAVSSHGGRPTFDTSEDPKVDRKQSSDTNSCCSSTYSTCSLMSTDVTGEQNMSFKPYVVGQACNQKTAVNYVTSPIQKECIQEAEAADAFGKANRPTDFSSVPRHTVNDQVFQCKDLTNISSPSEVRFSTTGKDYGGTCSTPTSVSTDGWMPSDISEEQSLGIGLIKVQQSNDQPTVRCCSPKRPNTANCSTVPKQNLTKAYDKVGAATTTKPALLCFSQHPVNNQPSQLNEGKGAPPVDGTSLSRTCSTCTPVPSVDCLSGEFEPNLDSQQYPTAAYEPTNTNPTFTQRTHPFQQAGWLSALNTGYIPPSTPCDYWSSHQQAQANGNITMVNPSKADSSVCSTCSTCASNQSYDCPSNTASVKQSSNVGPYPTYGRATNQSAQRGVKNCPPEMHFGQGQDAEGPSVTHPSKTLPEIFLLQTKDCFSSTSPAKDSTTFNRTFLSNKHPHPYNKYVNSTNSIKPSTDKSPHKQETFDESSCSTCTPIPPVVEHSVSNGTSGRTADVTPKCTEYHNSFTKAAASKSPAVWSTTNNHCPNSFAKYLPTANSSVPDAYRQTISAVQQSSGRSLSTCPHEEVFRPSNSGCVNPSISNFPPHMKATATLQKQSDSSLCSTCTGNYSRVYSSAKQCFENANSESREFHSFSAGNAGWDGGEVANFPFDRPIFCSNIPQESNLHNSALHDSSSDSSVLTVQLTSNPTASKYQTDVYEQSSLYTKSSFTSFSSFESSSQKFGMPAQHHRVAELKKRESFQFVFGEPYSRGIEVGSPYISFQTPSCNTNCNADSTQAQPANQPKFRIHKSSNVHARPINLQSHNVYCESRMSSKTEIMCTTPNPVSCLSDFFPPGEKPAFLETKAVYISVSNKFQPKNQTDAVNCNDDDAKSDVSDMKTVSCSFNPEESATKLDKKPTVEEKYEPDTKVKKTGSGIHLHVSIHNNLNLPCSRHSPADCVQCKTNMQAGNKGAPPETKTGSSCCNFGASYAELAHELNETTKELLDFIRAEWPAQTAQQPPKSGENYLSDKMFQQPFHPQAMSDECYGHFAEHTKQFTRHVSTSCDPLSENVEPSTDRLPNSAKIVHQKVDVSSHPPCHLSQAKQIDVTHLPEHYSNSLGETFVSSQENSSCYDVHVVPNSLPVYFDIDSKNMGKQKENLRSRSPITNTHPTNKPLQQIYTNSGQSSCLPPQTANCTSLTANCSSSSYTTSSIDSPVYPAKNIAQKDKTCEPLVSPMATSGKETQEQRFVFQPPTTLTGTSYQPSIHQEARQMSPSFWQRQKDAIQLQGYDCNTSGETSLTTDSSREFPFLSEVFVKSSIPVKVASCEQQTSAVAPSNRNNVRKNPDPPLDPYASDTPVLGQMSDCGQALFPIPLSFGGMPSYSAAYDYNSDAGISSTSATHGDPSRDYHIDSNEAVSSTSPCQRSGSTHAPSPSFPPSSYETNKITSATPNCHDYTNGVLTDSTSDHKVSSGELQPDSAISTKANTLPYETQDKSPPCVKTCGTSTANGPDVTVKVTSFNCNAAYAGVPVHGNDPFLPLHSVLVKVRPKATDTSVVTRVLYPHSNFPSSPIIKGPYYNKQLSISDPVTDISSTTQAEAQSAGDTTPSSDTPLATNDQPSSIEFDESRANGDHVSIKRDDPGVASHQQHVQYSECPQQGLSSKLHVGSDGSDVQPKENLFVQPNTPLGNQAFQPLPSTGRIPSMNLLSAVAEEGQSNDRVKDASSKEVDSKAQPCTAASSSNSSSINLLNLVDSSSSSEKSKSDVADGDRIDTQPNVLSPSIEKLPPNSQHEACPPSDIKADKMPDSHPCMSIQPLASHDQALDTNDSKQPSNVSTKVCGSANKPIGVTHPSFESHNSITDQNALLAVNKPPSRRFSIGGQCLVRRCSHSRRGYLIPTEGSEIIPPCNTAASSWSRSSADSTKIPPHLSELPFFEANTPATYSTKSEKPGPNSQFVRYFKNGIRQPPTTRERRASESGVDKLSHMAGWSRTISPVFKEYSSLRSESSSKPVGMARRTFQRPTSPPARLTRRMSEAVETAEKATLVDDNILSTESPEYKIWSHILSGPKVNKERKHIASTTLTDVPPLANPPIDGHRSLVSHSSTDSPSVYKTCSGGTTLFSKPLSEDATPLVKPLSEDTTPLAKPLSEDATPLVKPLSEDTTSLAKPLSEDTTSLAKPLSEDTTSLAKPLSEDTTPLAKPLSEDTTPLAKPLSEDTTLLVKPLSEDTTSLAKPLNRNVSPLVKSVTEERASFSKMISEDTPPLTKPWSEDTPPHGSQSSVSMSLIDVPSSEDGDAPNSFGLPTVTEQLDQLEEPVEQTQPTSSELGADSFVTVQSQASPEPFGSQSNPVNCQRPAVPSGPKKRRRRSISDSISPHSIIWSLLQTEQKEIYLEGKPISESLEFLRKCLPLTADMTPLDRFVYIYVYNKRYTEMTKERLQEGGVCAYVSHLLVEPFMMDGTESTELMDPTQHDEQCLAAWQSHFSEDAEYFYS